MKYFLTAFFVLLALSTLPGVTSGMQVGAMELIQGEAVTDDPPYMGMLIGGVIVFIFYSLKFRDWPDEKQKPPGFPARPTRDFTTWLNYQLWASVYILSGLLIAVCLFATPHQVIAVACTVVGDLMTRLCEEGTPTGAQYSLEALTLGVATAIAFLGLPKVEPAWRQQLQKLAMIPSRAVSLAHSLQDEFKQFSPEGNDVKRFLDRYKTHAGRPALYENDFSESLEDETYLETYPRIEFIINRLERLKKHAKGEQHLKDYNDDINEVKSQVNEIRSRIMGVHQAIKGTFGRRFPGEIAQMHADAGYNLTRNGPYSVTLLDNIIKESGDWSDEHTASDKELTQFFSESLREIRSACDEATQRLVQIVVLMSLRGMDQPYHVLKDLGFSKKLQKQSQIGLDLAPVIFAFIFVAGLLISFGLQVGRTAGGGKEIFVFAVAMPLASMIGALIVAGATETGDPKTRELRMGTRLSWDLTLCGVAGASMAIFVISFLPKVFGLGTPDQDFTEALFYTPVTGFLGAYMALCSFRKIVFPEDAAYRRVDFLFVPLGIVVFVVIARLLTHLDDRSLFFQWTEMQETIKYSVAGVFMGLCMMLPLWIQHCVSKAANARIDG